MRTLKRRWYDDTNTIVDTFEELKKLDSDSKKMLSSNLIEITRQIKDLHKEGGEPDLSLGIERVIGLYHQLSSSRRWYDKNNEIAYAFKVLFTLPTEDFLNIVEGLTLSLEH